MYGGLEDEVPCVVHVKLTWVTCGHCASLKFEQILLSSQTLVMSS